METTWTCTDSTVQASKQTFEIPTALRRSARGAAAKGKPLGSTSLLMTAATRPPVCILGLSSPSTVPTSLRSSRAPEERASSETDLKWAQYLLASCLLDAKDSWCTARARPRRLPSPVGASKLPPVFLCSGPTCILTRHVGRRTGWGWGGGGEGVSRPGRLCCAGSACGRTMMAGASGLGDHGACGGWVLAAGVASWLASGLGAVTLKSGSLQQIKEKNKNNLECTACGQASSLSSGVAQSILWWSLGRNLVPSPLT